MNPYAGRWRALVWDSEDDVVADLEALGWTLIELGRPEIANGTWPHDP